MAGGQHSYREGDYEGGPNVHILPVLLIVGVMDCLETSNVPPQYFDTRAWNRGSFSDYQLFRVDYLPELPIHLQIRVEITTLLLELEVEGTFPLCHFVGHVKQPLQCQTGLALPPHDLNNPVVVSARGRFLLLLLLAARLGLTPDVSHPSHVTLDIEGTNVQQVGIQSDNLLTLIVYRRLSTGPCIITVQAGLLGRL